MIFSELDHRMSVVLRWSVVETIRKQNLSTHSYNVAIMADRIARRLSSDLKIAHAAVLLILFTADPTVAAHDLGVWAARASAHALPLWPRVERSLAIGDRVGHRVCTLALWPIERRG